MTDELEIKWVVFDLGGVLVELDGPPISPAEANLSEAEIWALWLRSKAVRKFESGACNQQQFAAELIAEFKLSLSPAQLLEQFERWPIGFFPESEAIVQALHGRTRIACLSNTSDLHWQRFKQESPIFSMMEQRFFSFELGLMKPDAAIYLAVQEALNVAPEHILFLDDNQLNVAAALDLGWRAERTRGPGEVQACLKQYHLLE